jgi:serine/threonine protein kinase
MMKRTCRGTEGYKAPEVEMGDPYSSNADIWSYGCCFFQVLTGKKPYANASDIQIMQLIKKYTPLEYCNEDCRNILDLYPGTSEILGMCFQRNERPKASELLAHQVFKHVVVPSENFLE